MRLHTAHCNRKTQQHRDQWWQYHRRNAVRMASLVFIPSAFTFLLRDPENWKAAYQAKLAEWKAKNRKMVRDLYRRHC